MKPQGLLSFYKCSAEAFLNLSIKMKLRSAIVTPIRYLILYIPTICWGHMHHNKCGIIEKQCLTSVINWEHWRTMFIEKRSSDRVFMFYHFSFLVSSGVCGSTGASPTYICRMKTENSLWTGLQSIAGHTLQDIHAHIFPFHTDVCGQFRVSNVVHDFELWEETWVLRRTCKLHNRRPPIWPGFKSATFFLHIPHNSLTTHQIKIKNYYV